MKRKILGIVLSILMVFTFMPTYAFADVEEPVVEGPTEEPTVEEPIEEPIEEPLVEAPVEENEEEPIEEEEPALEEEIMPMMTMAPTTLGAFKKNYETESGSSSSIIKNDIKATVKDGEGTVNVKVVSKDSEKDKPHDYDWRRCYMLITPEAGYKIGTIKVTEKHTYSGNQDRSATVQKTTLFNSNRYFDFEDDKKVEIEVTFVVDKTIAPTIKIAGYGETVPYESQEGDNYSINNEFANIYVEDSLVTGGELRLDKMAPN